MTRPTNAELSSLQIIAKDIEGSLGINLPSPLIPFELIDQPLIRCWCKRDDLIHPIISGNKWRKLRISLARAIKHKRQHIMSFGGAHSNHLHALAYACQKLGIKFTAIVRGDYSQNLTPTLLDLSTWQSDIVFVSNQDYRKRVDSAFAKMLMERINADEAIAEGGSQADGVLGMQQLADELNNDEVPIQHLFLPIASGASYAGLIRGLRAEPSDLSLTQLCGIAVLKGEGYLESLVAQLNQGWCSQQAEPSHAIYHDFHAGGYAKITAGLQHQIFAYNQSLPFQVEPVYSAKALMAMHNLLLKQQAQQATNCVFLHTGGLPTTRINHA